jgi:autotransporter-associated beta strand protein
MTSIREQVTLRDALARGGLFAAAIASLILFLPLSASALTFHWIGGATGNWNDPAEWDTQDGGAETAWPSTPGDIAVFPAAIASAVTVTIPTGVNAAFGDLQIQTNFSVTIQRAGTGQIIVGTGSEADNGDISITGTGTHFISAPVRMDRHVTIQVASAVASVSFSGGIGQTGTRNLNKTGPGAVRFTAAVNNTYTGTTTVASGVLELQTSSSGIAILGPLVIGQGVTPNTARVSLFQHHQIANTSNVTVRRDGTFALNGFSETVAALTVEDGTVTLGGTGDLFVSGLSMTGGVINIGNAVDSVFVLQGNVTATSSPINEALIQSAGGTFSLSGADRTFTVNDGPAGNDLAIGAPIIGTGGETLIKDGSGAMSMEGGFANSYLGATAVRHGRLSLDKTTGPAIAGALLIGNGAGAANSAHVRLMTANQIGDSSPVEIGPDGLLDTNGLSDAIDTLQIVEGAVLVGPTSTLTTSSVTLIGGAINIGAAAALRLNNNIHASSTATQLATINGSGTIQLNGATRVLNVNNGPQAIDLRVDANIAGTGTAGLAKTGPGVALLAGTGTYTGETVIGGGTLLVNGTLDPTGFVLPSNPAATLGGIGNVGQISVGSGRLAPGLSPGILTSHGVVIGAGFPLVIELTGTTPGAAGYDQLRVIGGVFIGMSVLELHVSFDPPPRSTFTIVDNDGSDPVNGTFAGLDEGATVSVGDGYSFRISYVGGDGNDIVLTLTGDNSYYLAEGATGEFFDNDVLIANPNLVDAPVTLTFLLEGGTTIVENRTVAAQSRMTVSVDAIPGLESTSASVQVTSTSDVPLIVERTMSWDSTHYGGHTANAVTHPAMGWNFAEGFQGFFDTYVLIANATATPGTATLTFLREGETPFVTSVPIGAFSRKTVYAGDYPELVNRAFGIVVEATVPVIAERAMYFASVPGKFWGGGHVNTGTTMPSMTWFHAEGATGTFFNTFILLSNPDPTPATVELRFLLESGEVITRAKTVPANQRLTINPASEGDPRLENGSMSTVVTSDVPIVSERSMYWPGDASPFGEGHNSAGIVNTALRWGLAEGRIGGPLAYDTYILLTNATAGPAEVRVTYLREAGAAPVVKTYTVPATSRFNIDVRSMVPEMADESFGALIESTNSVNIAVERSLYWTANGIFWAGGTNALGTPLP